MEVSGIQAGQKRGAVQASTSMSSRVSGMSEDELRSFCRVPDDIRLELSYWHNKINGIRIWLLSCRPEKSRHGCCPTGTIK